MGTSGARVDLMALHMNSEQKITQVEEALDGKRAIRLSPPYKGDGKGKIVELEQALDAYFKQYSRIPDIAYVDLIQADLAIKACMTFNSTIFNLFTPNGGIQGGYFFTHYMYEGKQVVLRQLC
jgi:hypothetical protein